MLRFTSLPEEFPLHTDAAGSAPPDGFGSFRVLHQIGAGTLGPVFRGFDSEGDRLVAIKLFRLDLPPERVHKLVAAFERLIAAELAHPAIAALVATGISANSAYLVEEFVAADSLDTAVREFGAAPPADTLRVAAQLAGALDFAAVVHIEHGSLHPRDVLLSSEVTKLTGLGIARALEAAGVTPPVRRPYSAPERIAGAAWNCRADIFSLAALVHELLWARRIAGHGADVASTLTELEGANLDRLREVFARALAANPDERYETALDFVTALKHAFPAMTLDDRAAASTSVEREPRLPLEPTPVADLELRRAEEERFAAVDAAPATAVPELPMSAPPIVTPAIAASSMPEPPIPEPPFRQVVRRERSGIAPLVFALLIGIAIGFAGGYGVGARDGRDDVPDSIAASPASTPPATPAPTTGNDATVNPTTTAPGATSPSATTPSPSVAPAAPAALPPAVTTPPAARTPETPVREKRAASGSLLVRSAPSGARVTIDGRDYGRTPLTVRELSAGAHRIEVQRDGYAAESRRVTITASQPSHSVTVRLAPSRGRGTINAGTGRDAEPRPSTPATTGRFTAPLAVESRPAGAKVFLDGRDIGTTPLSLSAVSSGEHALRIQLDGYRTWSASVRVVADQQNRVTASLER